MREVVIVNALRTAVGKATRGTLKDSRPDELTAAVIKELAAGTPELNINEIDDVVIGCAMPEAQQGMNMARQASLIAGIPHSASAITVNRFCSSGLQAIAQAAEHIMCGFSEVAIGGGAESMSMIPMGGFNLSPSPVLTDNYPDSYLNMGLTAERLAKKFEITREQSDEFAYRSHVNALKAIEEGKFKNEIVPFTIVSRALESDDKGLAKIVEKKVVFEVDEGPRRDTTPEALAKLKPAFHAKGVVTAGNSSQTSDGAAAALIMSADRAKQLGLKPMARFVAYATGGVAPEEMGIGPVVAIPKALKLAGLKIDDIDLIELNEAFCVQALSVIKSLGLDLNKINVNGGATAMGHPLGCTGAKLTATLLNEMKRRNSRYGMVTMCVGGGMGAAGIFENL